MDQKPLGAREDFEGFHGNVPANAYFCFLSLYDKPIHDLVSLATAYVPGGIILFRYLLSCKTIMFNVLY
jgi:hypothetical protein